MSLQQYPGSDLNKFSKTVQDYLDNRKLKPGDMVKYRLLNGIRNIDPQRRRGDDILFPASVSIPLTDNIYDPGEEGKNNGRVVQVGVVKAFNDVTKMPVFRKYAVQPQKGDNGIFVLRGGVIQEMEVYEALELSNRNKSNPFRDQSEEAMFERVDDSAESKVKSTKRNFLFDSLNAIRQWTPEEMRIIAASYNLSTSLPVDVLKDKLEEIAEVDPKKFYDLIDSEDTKIKAVIKLAMESGIIAFNAHENKWVYAEGGETIALLDRKEGINEMEQFKEFLKSSANGHNIKEQLKKLIKAGKESKK